MDSITRRRKCSSITDDSGNNSNIIDWIENVSIYDNNGNNKGNSKGNVARFIRDFKETIMTALIVAAIVMVAATMVMAA